jgi:tetratricopeptide (TPR) repeat protein
MYFSTNPYVAGNPVGDSPAFVGRSDVLREVLRVLRHPKENAIVLYGQRRIGKTSVLQELEAKLPKEGGYRPIFFDLQDKAQWSLARVLRELAQKISDQLGQPNYELGDDPETTFRNVWLPKLLNNLLPDTALVFLFDEFDVLADPESDQAGAAFFPYLRDLLPIDQKHLNFVFVIGRKVDDLTNIALSLFKTTPASHVSLLNQQDTIELIRLSEANNSLIWSDEDIETIWQLTNGHPFLTQRLCSCIWDRLYADDPEEPPRVTLKEIETAIPETLSASRNALEWLWKGLPPAERVVISALAGAGAKLITENELEDLLRESGVRVIIRELQNAPRLLQDWDLIEPVDDGYHFRVELLRRWVADYKPLNRVQEDLDHIEPVSNSLYQAGLGYYRGSQLEAALPILRQAINLNPNHIGANQLLADILLAQGKANEAHEILEGLYKYQPMIARPRLIQALLALAQSNDNDDERLKFYKQLLELDSEQPEAKSQWQEIWRRRGDEAYKTGDLETALSAYQKGLLNKKVAEVKQKIRQREKQLNLLNELEQTKRYQEALEQARLLAKKYPEFQDWNPILQQLERKLQLSKFYDNAKMALKEGDKETADTLLARVIALESMKDNSHSIDWHIITSSKEGIGQTLLTSLVLTHNLEYNRNANTTLVIDLNKVNTDISKLLFFQKEIGEPVAISLPILKGKTEQIILQKTFSTNQNTGIQDYYVVGWISNPFRMYDSSQFTQLLSTIKTQATLLIEGQLNLPPLQTVIIDTNCHFCNIFSELDIQYIDYTEGVLHRDSITIWFMWCYRQLENLIRLQYNDATIIKLTAAAIERNIKSSLCQTTPFMHVFLPEVILSHQELKKSRRYNIYLFILYQIFRYRKSFTFHIKDLETLEDLPITESIRFQHWLKRLKQAHIVANKDGDPRHHFLEIVTKASRIPIKDNPFIEQRPFNIIPISVYHEALLNYTDNNYIDIVSSLRNFEIYDKFTKLLDRKS